MATATKNPRTAASPAGDVPALDRALDILERLRGADRGLTLSELSSELELPKNAVFRITQTLLARGYLSRDPATLRFELTRRLLELGQPRAGRVALAEASLEPMRTLRDQTRETVQLGVRLDVPPGFGGVIVSQVEGLEALRIAVDIGLRFPLHNNAPGKLLLAWLSEAERDVTIDRLELVASTPRTITRKAELVKECERIRACGYSTDYAEADEGIHCVAAPIVNGQGGCVATVWVSAPTRRMPRDRFREVGKLTMEAGREISRRLAEGA